jgi:cystathionine beta-lyase/cystathionine gamma-synthase
VIDIAAAAGIAHGAGALLAVDSTAAIPVLTRPLALGADLLMNSATKYLNEHGDVMAGTLTSARGRLLGASVLGAQHRRRSSRRLSVGIEDPDDLIADLDAALSADK